MLVSAFEKKTGITVEVRSADEATLGNQILQEGSNSPADVFYAENTPVLEALREKSLLALVRPSTLAAVPSRYSAPDGRWVGVSARAAVMVYDTRLIKPSELPSSILQLAEPRFKGKLCVRALRDRLPAPDRIDHRARRGRRSEALAEGDAGQLRPVPGQRDGRLAGQQRPERDRPDRPVLLVPAARRARRGRNALRPAATTRRETRATWSTSPARRSCARARTSLPPRSSWPSWSAPKARRRSPAATATSTRCGRASRPQTALPPLASLHPAALLPAQLGDGHAPLVLEQDLGLL